MARDLSRGGWDYHTHKNTYIHTYIHTHTHTHTHKYMGMQKRNRFDLWVGIRKESETAVPQWGRPLFMATCGCCKPRSSRRM